MLVLFSLISNSNLKRHDAHITCKMIFYHPFKLLSVLFRLAYKHVLFLFDPIFNLFDRMFNLWLKRDRYVSKLRIFYTLLPRKKKLQKITKNYDVTKMNFRGAACPACAWQLLCLAKSCTCFSHFFFFLHTPHVPFTSFLCAPRTCGHVLS